MIETIKDVQNEQNTVNQLPITTKVYLRLELLQNKLEPKYEGPYFIDGYTRNRNYRLKDTNGKHLREAYALSRLKFFKFEEDKDD